MLYKLGMFLVLLAGSIGAADQYPLVFGPQGQPQQIAVGDTLNVQLTSGTVAARPAAAASNLGMVYWATDTNLIYRSTGSAWTALAVGGSGTVSSVGLALPSVFSVTGSPVTTSGTLSAALTTQSANAVWAGPTSGGAAQPTFRALISSDIPSLPYDASGAAAAVLATSAQKAQNLADLTSASTARTNLGLGSAALLASSAVAQTANNLSDLASASTARTNLGLGTAATHPATDFLLAASNLSDVANAATARANLGAGTGNGSVTSVAATVPSVLSISGSPITGAGTLAIGYSGTALPVANGGTGLTSDTAYAVFAGGTTTGGAHQQVASLGTSGQVLTSAGAGALPTWTTPAATGVTSVGLSLPGIFTVTGSPVTTTGTLTGTLATQSANTHWAGPTSGSAAAPSFRALVSADIPDISATYVTQSEVGAANGVPSLDSVGHLPIAQNSPGLMNYTAVADAAYTVLGSDAIVALTSITTSRTVTLPTSSTIRAGHRWLFIDITGSPGLLSQTLTWTITTGGTDKLNGVTNGTVIMRNPNEVVDLWHDGAGNFYTNKAIPDVQIFTANGTWTKPYGATMISGVVISTGGAGGSGQSNSQTGGSFAGGGGSGGGSSGVTPFNITAAAISATVTVTVPTAGSGGAAVTAGANAGTTNGLPVSTVTGATCSFGTYAVATGGASGVGNAGTATGGVAGTGTFAGVAGANGGANGTNTTPTQPTTNAAAPGAGGGGGAVDGAGPGNGGAGGNLPRNAGATGGGTGGIAGGANPGTPTSQPAGSALPGAGGGGGASAGASSPSANVTAQTGATGGSYGAGGGGGGGASVGNGLWSATSGAGGNGGPAIVFVVSN